MQLATLELLRRQFDSSAGSFQKIDPGPLIYLAAYAHAALNQGGPHHLLCGLVCWGIGVAWRDSVGVRRQLGWGGRGRFG